jgi:hypothetical protein
MRHLTLALALLAAVPRAHADAPSASSLQRLFEQLDVQRLGVQAIAALEEQHAQQVAQEPDAQKRARNQERHERLAAFIRQRLAWSELEPLALEVYGRELTAAQVEELLAYYATPVGQLHARKLLPSLVQASLASLRHMETTLEAAMEARDAAPAPTPWKPADAREAAAGELATELMKEEYDARVAGIEATLRGQMGMAEDATGVAMEGAMAGEVTKVAAYFRQHLTFEAVKPVLARRLAQDLTEAELQELLTDSRRPARRAQRAALQKAETALQARVQQWMMETVMPDLMKVMLEGEASGT